MCFCRLGISFLSIIPLALGIDLLILPAYPPEMSRDG
jgi:hypothetical protein